MAAKSISIRWSLIRSLALLTLLTAGTILVVTIRAGRNAVQDLSTRLIDEAAEKTRGELESFFGSVAAQVRTGRRWAQSGMLDADDPLALNDLFVPILVENPQLSSMMVSESEGTGYLLLRQALDRDEWLNRVVTVREEGNLAYKRYWNTRTGTLREETVPMDYDSRTRLWYTGSMATEPGVAGKDVHWTKPVIFFITKDPGITAGSHYTDAEGRSIVVAYDLLLLDIARLTSQRVRPSPGGTAFVLVEERDTDVLRVVGLPRDARYQDDRAIKEELIVVPAEAADTEAQLPRAADFPVGPVAPAVKAWREGGGREQGTFRFEHEGAWWGELRPYDVGPNRFWIGVAVPETDFLGEVEHQRDQVILITLLALLAAVGMAFLLARRYSRPLEQLVATSRRMKNLDLDAASLPVPATRLRELDALADSQRELASALQSFARYVPVDVVRELISRGEVAEIGGSTQALTILFTDIKGFTTISEQMRPQDLAEHMGRYFSLMLAELRLHGATVDKFVGDAIVAFWGAPTSDAKHAEHALESTLACMRRLDSQNEAWVAAGLPAMPTRFGLATGEVIVGNIGAQSRLSYTVLGDRVNLAARLEALNKLYGTDALVAGSVVEAAGGPFAWRRVDRVAVKGKSEAVDIYEPLGMHDDVPPGTRAFARAYEAALDAFQAGEFAQALAAVQALLAEHPGDLSLQRLAAGCEAFQQNPPPEGWDGVNRLDVK